MKTKRVRAYRSKIELRTTEGLVHVVTLSGPESAVKQVALMCSIGAEAQAVGIGPGHLTAAAHQARESMAGRIVVPS